QIIVLNVEILLMQLPLLVSSIRERAVRSTGLLRVGHRPVLLPRRHAGCEGCSSEFLPNYFHFAMRRRLLGTALTPKRGWTCLPLVESLRLLVATEKRARGVGQAN